jgi:hypothetical protein
MLAATLARELGPRLASASELARTPLRQEL